MPNTKTITKTKERPKTAAAAAAYKPCKEIAFETYWDFDDAKQILAESKIVGYCGPHSEDKDNDGVLKKPHNLIMVRFSKKTSSKQLNALFPEGFIANGVSFPIHNWDSFLRYLIHADNPEKTQYSADNVFTFGNIEPYKVALHKSAVAKSVPFDVFLFLALHSRMTNFAEYATVLEMRYPQLISAFGKLQSGQIAVLNRILESKHSVDLAFARSTEYEVFDSAADSEEQGRVAAFNASLGLYE